MIPPPPNFVLLLFFHICFLFFSTFCQNLYTPGTFCQMFFSSSLRNSLSVFLLLHFLPFIYDFSFSFISFFIFFHYQCFCLGSIYSWRFRVQISLYLYILCLYLFIMFTETLTLFSCKFLSFLLYRFALKIKRICLNLAPIYKRPSFKFDFIVHQQMYVPFGLEYYATNVNKIYIHFIHLYIVIV